VVTTRRNASVALTSVAVCGLLFLYPTSTNNTGQHRRPGQPLAPVGLVGSPAPPASTQPSVVTVNGAAVDTAYGLVQVQVKIQGRRILSATAIDYPQGSGRDRAINQQAVPVLQRETVAAQGAQIDTVSGATYTSDGYRRSLQAALDAAHLGP
jgi:uncharacterized protein with FMN-binding domain